MLSIYLDGEFLLSVDERYARDGPFMVTAGIPPASAAGTRVLGFRLDAFSAHPSSVTVSNVRQSTIEIGAPTGEAWTVINLHPAGATESSADGVNGGQQVGSAVVDRHGRASLWTGTAASWVHLAPGTFSSGAAGVAGGQQVGSYYIDKRVAPPREQPSS